MTDKARARDSSPGARTGEAEAARRRRLIVEILENTTSVLADALLRPSNQERGAALAGVSAAATLADVAELVLYAAVTEARSAGHTWADVGAALNTSRQNAQQRFGELNARSSALLGRRPTPNATQRAVEIVRSFLAGSPRAFVGELDPAVVAMATPEDFEQLAAEIQAAYGEPLSFGTPVLRTTAAHTVVDVPVAFATAELQGRITFNHRGNIVALALLDTPAGRQKDTPTGTAKRKSPGLA